MFYTNKPFILAILLLLLSACSQTSPSRGDKDQRSVKSSAYELALYQKGVIALSNNELEKAQAHFTQMSELQPDMAGSWANLALISLQKEALTEAQEHVATALEKNPNMPQALNLSGYLHQKQGRVNKAKALYLQAISVKADYANAHYNLALLYDIYLQDIPMAVEHYQLYLSFIDTKDEATENWLAELKASL